MVYSSNYHKISQVLLFYNYGSETTKQTEAILLSFLYFNFTKGMISNASLYYRHKYLNSLVFTHPDKVRQSNSIMYEIYIKARVQKLNSRKDK